MYNKTVANILLREIVAPYTASCVMNKYDLCGLHHADEKLLHVILYNVHASRDSGRDGTVQAELKPNHPTLSTSKLSRQRIAV